MATTKRVTITKDTVSLVFGAIQDLVGRQVLVGIPESNAPRDETEGPNNAYLAFIHEFGSPAQNIPARAFLIPGVENAKPQALEQLKKAAQAALEYRKDEATQRLNKAGMVGVAAAKDKIMNGPFVPLSPKTVARRRFSRKTQSMRPAEKQYLKLISQGVSPQDAQDTAGIRPLINTGALRDSLTYVVRKKG